MTKLLKDRPFLKKFLISYFFMLAIPMILNVITSHASWKAIREHIEESNTVLISQIRFVLDRKWENLENLVLQIGQNQRLDLLSKQRPPLAPDFQLEMQTALKEINSYIMLKNNIANDMYIILPGSGYVTSGKNLIPLDIFFEYNFHYGNWTKDDWMQYLSNGYRRSSFLPEDTILSGTESFDGILFIKTIPFYFNTAGTAMVLFTVKKQDLFGYYFNETDNRTQIVPRLFLAGNRSSLVRGIPDPEETYVEIEATSPDYDLIYAVSVPYKATFQQLMRIKMIMLTFNLLALLLGGGAAVYFARSNANPLYALIKTMQKTLPPEGMKQPPSLDFLSDSVSRLIRNNNSLKSLLDEHKKVIGQEFFHRLVKHGFDSPAEMESIRLYLNKTISKGLSGVILLNLQVEEGMLQERFEELQGIKLSIMELLRPASTYPGLWLNLENASIAYIFRINSTDRGLWFQSMRKEIHGLQEELEAQLNLDFIWAVGNPVEDAFVLNSSYQQAKLIINELPRNPEKKLFEYALFTYQMNSYNLPIDLIQKLLNLVKTGDYDLAGRVFLENWHENMQNKRLNLRNQQLYFMDLQGLLLRLKPDLIESPGILEFHRETPETIKKTVLDAMEEVCEAQKGSGSSSHNRLKAKLTEYLEQNYAMADMSLSTIAAEFDRSEGYLSHFFKKHCSGNFYAILETLRMEKAADLLLHADLPIKKVALQSGYSNEQTFRRVFKKRFGVPPSSYKEITLKA